MTQSPGCPGMIYCNPEKSVIGRYFDGCKQFIIEKYSDSNRKRKKGIWQIMWSNANRYS